jgi:hypothetical protein
MPTKKVQVSERAVLQRLNRKLQSQNLRVKKARGFYADGVYHENSNLGRYYVINVGKNSLSDSHVRLEALGRDEGCLAPWEEIAEDAE